MSPIKAIFKARWQAWLNGLIRGRLGWKGALLYLLGVGFMGFYGFLIAMRMASWGDLEFALPRLFGVSSLILLSMAPATSLHTLFLAGDLDLIMAAPLTTRQVFLVKLTDTIWGAWPLLLLVTFSLASYTFFGSQGLAFLLLGLLVLGLLAALLNSLAMAVALLAGGLIAPGKLNAFAGFLAMVIFFPLYMALATQFGESAAGKTAFTLISGLTNTPPVAWGYAPLWAVATGAPVPWDQLLLLVAATLVAMRLAWWAFALFALRGITSAKQVSKVHHKVGRRPLTGAGARWHKEWVTLMREPRRLTGLLMPVLVLGFMLYSLNLDSGQGTPGFIAVPLFGTLTALMLSLNMALPLLPSEGRGLSLLKSAPLTEGQLITGKFQFGLMMVAVLTLVITLATAIITRATPLQLGYSLVSVLLASAALTWLGICLGAISGNWTADDPNRAVGCGGMLAHYLLGMLISGLLILPATVLPLFWQQLTSSPLWLAGTLAGLMLALGLPVLALWIITKMAIRRLANWEEIEITG